ncbi:hypothetical protein EFQ99_29855 [Rhizobium vallis]|uniref:Uncharacterized protein n=1 Tax=Rhizobium vallis TaxID=634290 RepID=A0A432PBP7_9HYPH|nr:hypothetical protein EFQ99_29855 [Rhizobium vallis]
MEGRSERRSFSLSSSGRDRLPQSVDLLRKELVSGLQNLLSVDLGVFPDYYPAMSLRISVPLPPCTFSKPRRAQNSAHENDRAQLKDDSRQRRDNA